MKLSILNIADPLVTVGPDCTDGAEQILTQLDVALEAQGHRSLVIAAQDSVVTGDSSKLPFDDPPSPRK
jgi:hypothetical protein